MPSEDQVRELLLQALSPIHLTVSDFSDGCGAKFEIVVVSNKFDGLKLLERHRSVNDALKPLMPEIHAVTMKTYTEEQWKKISNNANAAEANAKLGGCIKN